MMYCLPVLRMFSKSHVQVYGLHVCMYIICFGYKVETITKISYTTMGEGIP